MGVPLNIAEPRYFVAALQPPDFADVVNLPQTMPQRLSV